jgi:rSAM/selenodomain-associated transferase 2
MNTVEIISIVMPVLNEGKILHNVLESLPLSHGEELIIIDGGSEDHTFSTALRYTQKAFVTHKGRGHQMNYGAKKARGSILLFLHADSVLPKNAFSIIRTILRDHGVSAGAFDLCIDHPSFRFRIIEMGANLRSRVTSVPYGDQGIFLRKEVFDKIGGYADVPIMEDIEISQRLKNEGKIAFVRPAIKTSPRRWLKEGAAYTTLRDWTLALSYSILKVSPERLMKHYKDVR